MEKKAGLGDYPKTWDEVEAAAKKIEDRRCIWNYHQSGRLSHYELREKLRRRLGRRKNDQLPGKRSSLAEVFDMYKEGLAVTPKSLGYGWDGEVFANGKAAMTTGGYWYKGYLKDANPNLKYAAVPVPKGTVEGSTMISDAYVVLKDAKNKEAALQAAYYLTNDKTQTEFLKLGFNPAIPSLSAQYFEENPEFKAVEPALEYSTDFNYPTETKKFIDELVKQLEGSILGGTNKSPKEILDSVQQQFK